MAGETVSRAQLSQALHEEVGLSQNESAEHLETVLREISGALIEGGSVKISGFGSFLTRQKNERIGRNPNTGEEVTILPRRVIVFRASPLLKSRINSGHTKAPEDIDLDTARSTEPGQE